MTALEAVQLGAHQQRGVEFAPPTGIPVESILCTGDVACITNRDYVIAFTATPAVELLRVANRERIGPAIRAGMKRAFCDVSPEMDALLVTAPFGFPWPPGYQPPVTGVLCLTKVPYGPGKRRRSHTLICEGDGHYLLPTIYYLLPTTYCLPPTAYCLLPTTYIPLLLVTTTVHLSGDDHTGTREAHDINSGLSRVIYTELAGQIPVTSRDVQRTIMMVGPQ